MLGHVAGLPLEEALLGFLPVAAIALAAGWCSLRGAGTRLHRRRR